MDAACKHGGGRRKLKKDKVGCLKGNMRENVTYIFTTVMFQNLCGRHTKQVQLDDLEHFATKELAVIDLTKKKNETQQQHHFVLFFSHSFTSSVPRDVKALQPEGQS